MRAEEGKGREGKGRVAVDEVGRYGRAGSGRAIGQDGVGGC